MAPLDPVVADLALMLSTLLLLLLPPICLTRGMWEVEPKIAGARRSGREVEDGSPTTPMLKILDFSLDVDRSADSNGSYTHASLEKENLPTSFTICSAFMVQAWITDFSAAEIFALKTGEGVTWAYVHLYCAADYTEYKVDLGSIKMTSVIPELLFPLKWTRVCLALDAFSGTVRLVVDGDLLGEEEYKAEEDTGKPSNLFLVSGYYRNVDYVKEYTGRVSNLNIFSSALPLEKLLAMTRAGDGECGAGGDFLRWENTEWLLHSHARLVEVEPSKGPCRRESKIQVFTADFKSHRGCMEHCRKIGGGRSPSLLTSQQWKTLTMEVGTITDFDFSVIPWMWMAVTEGDVDKKLAKPEHWPSMEPDNPSEETLSATEGVWRDYYTGEKVNVEANYPDWYPKHDTRYGEEYNCLGLYTDQAWEKIPVDGWFEWQCILTYDSYGMSCPCEYQRPPLLSLRGLCGGGDSPMDNTFTPVQLAGDPNNMLLLGHEHTRIEFNDSTNLWTLTDAKSIVSATSRSTKVSYVLGKHTWEVANDVYECHKGEPYTTQLKLTGCDQQGEFTCNDGQCVRMEERCDQLPNCRDESDEDNCQLLILKNNYNNKVPPITTVSAVNFTIVPAPVYISITLMKIVSIEEVSHMITLKFEIVLKWKEVRATYQNLKFETSLNALTDDEAHKLWLPYAIFDNTDDNEAVQLTDEVKTTLVVSREGEFTRSGVEVVDEVEVFQGSENSLALSQTHSKRFQCQYRLNNYPFDTQVTIITSISLTNVRNSNIQVCSIRIVTSKLDVKTVSFLPKDVLMEEELELTMYIIQKWMLVRDMDDKSGQSNIKFIVVLERRIMSELLSTYLPTILLISITFSTTFFKAEYFEVI